jgi:toxin-antitoxin system PIN domain toxin
MIAIDTNILVYAHRRESAFHDNAKSVVRTCAEGADAWAIPWPCIHEFLAVVTNPRVFRQPTPLKAALDQVQSWCESPSLRLLAEDDGYWPILSKLVKAGDLRGAKVHDARIAALVLYHGARELLSADRDFSRMAPLAVRNPLC